jgi:putative SOS response-associated peptidase YedK
MCGRCYSELTWEEYCELLRFEGPPPSNFEPSYNIAPTAMVPVAFAGTDKAGVRHRVVRPLHWGLVPPRVTDRKEAGKSAAMMFNARAETLEEKPSFRGLLADHRCIVPVSGFYEWTKTEKKDERQAHKVEHADGAPMLLAGLWTANRTLNLRSYTVITTAAPAALSEIHPRCPAILTPDQADLWLDGEWNEAGKLLGPFAGDIRPVPVSNAAGNVRNNYRELLEPLK